MDAQAIVGTHVFNGQTLGSVAGALLAIEVWLAPSECVRDHSVSDQSVPARTMQLASLFIPKLSVIT